MKEFWSRLKGRVLLLLAAFRGRPEVAPILIGPRPYPWEASYPTGLDWDFACKPVPMSAVLDEATAAWPERPCMEFLGRRYNYRETGELVAKAAKGFQELGVTNGTRVGLLMPNSPFFVICYFAVLKAGGTVVNFNPLYAEREVARQIEDSNCRILVTMNLKIVYGKVARRLEDTCLEKVVICPMGQALSLTKRTLFLIFKRNEVAAIPSDEQHIKFDRLIANDGRPAPVLIDPAQDIAVLQYTGGTTGVPKGAMLTHANLHANLLQTRLWARDFVPGEEKVLAVLPLFHVFGMTAVMNLALKSGAELLLMPRFKVSEVLAAIDREKPTVLMGVPTIYSAINAYKDIAKYDLSSLRYCISGGAALPLAVQQAFEGITGCTLVEGYGLTEAAPVCTINPSSGPKKPGSAGLPLPGTLIDIVALDDPRRSLPIGETGEIVVAGPQVMAGYWRQEEETRNVMVRGRLRTGDVGYLDEDGYLYIIDRIKDLIISGGFNVYPRMVEEAIYLHPAVEEVAVVGVPHTHRGEIVKAFVKLKAGEKLTGTQLRDFLKDELAPFQVPRRVEFRDEIPKTLIGKPLRRALQEQERRKQAKQGNGAEAAASDGKSTAAADDAPPAAASSSVDEGALEKERHP